MFQGKTKEAQKLAEFEVDQKKKDKLYLDEMRQRIDLDYKTLQVIMMLSLENLPSFY
jgi:hypothetical protein